MRLHHWFCVVGLFNGFVGLLASLRHEDGVSAKFYAAAAFWVAMAIYSRGALEDGGGE